MPGSCSSIARALAALVGGPGFGPQQANVDASLLQFCLIGDIDLFSARTRHLAFSTLAAKRSNCVQSSVAASFSLWSISPRINSCELSYFTAAITLTSTLDVRQTACPGEVATYICTLTQTIHLEWTAVPFINNNNRLQFTTTTPPENRVLCSFYCAMC